MDKLQNVFHQVKRTDFLPDEVKQKAEFDAPLPIGYGQTNSQPSTVYQMLNWLNIKNGNNILDLGSGSGWTSALISKLAGNNGMVYAVEKLPELVRFGRKNVRNAGIKNVKFFKAGDIIGLPQFAPYDRILVSAAAKELPVELIDQIKPEGKIVIPIKNDIYELSKNSGGKIGEIIKHPGFVFVPLT